MKARLVYVDGALSKLEPIKIDPADDDLLTDGVELWTVDATIPPSPAKDEFNPLTQRVRIETIEDHVTKTRRLVWVVEDIPGIDPVAEARRALIKTLGGNLRAHIELDRENWQRARDGQAALTLDEYLDQLAGKF